MSAPSQPGTARNLRWAGTRAFLVECGCLTDVMRLHAHLSASPYPGQTEVLAAAATVLLEFESTGHALSAARDVVTLSVSAHEGTETKTVEIDVVYDGADLADVGEHTGLGEQGVIRAHTEATWTAAFGGFSPGFAYLVAPGDPLQVPRRSTPRTEVPAGSVALAGAFAAVYPQKSPGGWQLIGHTGARLWDLSRENPALIRPGDTVRYRAVRERVTVAPSAPGQPEHTPAEATYGLVVEDPGMQSLPQDLGRPGLGDLGVVASGAADRASARQANRLVGNDSGAVVIESLMDGLSVTARGHHALALTGASGPATVAGPHGAREAPRYAAFPLYDGETLTLGVATHGLRTYLAARGGFDVPEALGSSSRDVISGIGPDPLAAGDVLAVDTGTRAVGQPEGPAVDAPSTGQLPAVGGPGAGEDPAVPLPDDDETATLRCVPGPRDDWFSPAAFETLTTAAWTVSSQSNRVGVRFDPPQDGSVLERSCDGELVSEGVAVGSLQVPHSGVPVLFLADHPVTGGYPVIAVVLPDDLPLAAQLPPGSTVRFRLVDRPSSETTGEPA